MSDAILPKLCAFDGCSNHAGGKLCGGHAKQKRLGQTLRPLRKQMPPGSVCGFPGCCEPYYAHGLCAQHNKHCRDGKELKPIKRTRSRKLPFVIEYDEVPCPNPDLEGPCHVFRGAKTVKGYGQASINNKSVLIHRLAWKRHRGPIPEGLVIDHQCRNRACCNVAHLRLVTTAVNVTENVIGNGPQIMAARTHCPQGHAYDEKNTYRSKLGHRGCRSCNRNRSAKRKEVTG
jgi:hypothetical protein